jgi:hypothetical protein
MEDIIKQKGCQIFRVTGCELRATGTSIADLGFEIADWKN